MTDVSTYSSLVPVADATNGGPSSEGNPSSPWAAALQQSQDQAQQQLENRYRFRLSYQAGWLFNTHMSGLLNGMNYTVTSMGDYLNATQTFFNNGNSYSQFEHMSSYGVYVTVSNPAYGNQTFSLAFGSRYVSLAGTGDFGGFDLSTAIGSINIASNLGAIQAALGQDGQAQQWVKAQQKEQAVQALERLLSDSSSLQVLEIKYSILDDIKEGKSLEEALQDLRPNEQTILAKALHRFSRQKGAFAPDGTGYLLKLVGQFTDYRVSPADELMMTMPECEGDYDEERLTGAKKILSLLGQGQSLQQIYADHHELGLDDVVQLRSVAQAMSSRVVNPQSPLKLFADDVVAQANALIGQERKKNENNPFTIIRRMSALQAYQQTEAALQFARQLYAIVDPQEAADHEAFAAQYGVPPSLNNTDDALQGVQQPTLTPAVTPVGTSRPGGGPMGLDALIQRYFPLLQADGMTSVDASLSVADFGTGSSAGLTSAGATATAGSGGGGAVAAASAGGGGGGGGVAF
ncbi:MAG: hypothetical protein KC476_07370 [Cyanobacteria bacterium HKST-UBA06]|nr:hypothetical protein [Cyanobacteria bacterium HKST-UBA04]MCA9807761.1 hypothetical protein [Cyanobacteria bacterium HKST-UBA06]